MGDTAWQAGKAYREIIYETCDGIAKITINRPERRNAFTPLTVNELYDAFTVARDDAAIGVIILTGANHEGRSEDQAFCSGGDRRSAATAAMWARTTSRASTCWTSSASSAWCPSPSSPW